MPSGVGLDARYAAGVNDGYVYSDVLGNDAAGSTVLAYMARAYLHSSSEVWAARIAVGRPVAMIKAPNPMAA